MKTKKFILAIVMLLSLFVFTAVFIPGVDAASAYKTYTLDRNNNFSTTNEAYEAVYMLRSFSDNTTLNGAKDLFIDKDDYFYIADTGNKRVVVCDPEMNLLYSFGTDVLIKPLGIYVVQDYIYVADYGLGLQNTDLGAVYIYHIDKTKSTVEEAITLVDTISTPESALLSMDGFIFRPMKIAVDENFTMYIVNEGTTSGVLMVNASNRFINYFASNSIDITLWERIQRIVFQNNENVYMTKNIPTPVYNITMDGNGYFYTVTQKTTTNSTGDNLKKVSIGGTNFFPEDMFVFSDIVDAWPGDVGNIYAVTSNGFLLEYDNLGNLLFCWGGKGTGNDKLGLFMSASSIAMDSNNNLYVIDSSANRNSIQVFRETAFAYQVHEALDLYNQAKYVESIEVWEEVLRYNSMLDMAYRGIGLGYMMNEDYKEALEMFKIAYDHEDYSEAYWEIRNVWLTANISTILWVVFALFIGILVVQLTNRKYHYLAFVTRGKESLRKYRFFDELFFMGRFITNPADACYEVKFKKRVSIGTAFFVLAMLFVLYILGIVYTGFVFNYVILENTILINEALSIIIPIIIFVVANYLMSSLMEGEGTFKATFINTIGSLMPVFLIYPFVIVLSNFLTLNESFLVTLGITVMFGWSAILVFFNIKETHNYSVGQTIVNLILTFLMMIIIIVILILVYLMVLQVSSFITDIIKEVILRE